MITKGAACLRQRNALLKAKPHNAFQTIRYNSCAIKLATYDISCEFSSGCEPKMHCERIAESTIRSISAVGKHAFDQSAQR